MYITNQLFAPAAANMTPASDNSLLTLGIYVMVYGTLAYTLANSAFKAIDMLPNFVMAWIGQRMESRVDDASAVQQQAGQYMQTLAYSSRNNAGSSSAEEKLSRDSQTLANLKSAGVTDPNIIGPAQTAVNNDQAAVLKAQVGGGTGPTSGTKSSIPADKK
jgi:hypothetical protein